MWLPPSRHPRARPEDPCVRRRCSEQLRLHGEAERGVLATGARMSGERRGFLLPRRRIDHQNPCRPACRTCRVGPPTWPCGPSPPATRSALELRRDGALFAPYAAAIGRRSDETGTPGDDLDVGFGDRRWDTFPGSTPSDCLEGENRPDEIGVVRSTEIYPVELHPVLEARIRRERFTSARNLLLVEKTQLTRLLHRAYEQ